MVYQFNPQQSLTYNDLGLVPRSKSNIRSRAIDTNTSTSFLEIPISLPVVLAPMKKVVGSNMVSAVNRLGGLCFLPTMSRGGETFGSDSSLLLQCDTTRLVASVPATGNYLDRIKWWHYEYGVKHFCVDVANGFSKVVEEAMIVVSQTSPDI